MSRDSIYYRKLARLYSLKLAKYADGEPMFSSMPAAEPLETPVPFGPPTAPTGSAPAKSKPVVSIDPRIQQGLRNAGFGKFLGTSGPDGNGVDGKLGDRTRAALNAYKAKMNLNSASDEEVFDHIRHNTNTGVSNRQFPEDPKPAPGSSVAPTGSHSTGISNKQTGSDSAGIPTPMAGPK